MAYFTIFWIIYLFELRRAILDCEAIHNLLIMGMLSGLLCWVRYVIYFTISAVSGWSWLGWYCGLGCDCFRD